MLQDAERVYANLEDDITEAGQRFRVLLQRIYKDYISVKESGNLSVSPLKGSTVSSTRLPRKHFALSLNSALVEKMQDELMSMRATIKNLDLTQHTQALRLEGGDASSLIREAMKQNNDKLFAIIRDLAPIFLQYNENLNLEVLRDGAASDPNLLMERILGGTSTVNQINLSDIPKKSIKYQVYELVKENIQFRMMLNFLTSILDKYKRNIAA
eukprot:TRINITY_DN2061_c0_g1_i1.p1 TRINITY_DN2061_c0_g1~~TRINITY_DN2061_c0_g1_i1.p1  ORF type:complete len:213 (-),score=54.89 TRINITY_DN2061_c0_g1_i1:171-809(-)